MLALAYFLKERESSMNANLLSLAGKMCPDYEHPALVHAADAAAKTAIPSLGPTTPSASFVEALTFVDEFYQTIAAQTSLRSFPRLGTSGISEAGHFLTLDISASHSADSAYSECSLAAMLEPSVPLKYFLFATACNGILRRAEKRGRAIPAYLQQMLENVAATWPASYKEAVTTEWNDRSG